MPQFIIKNQTNVLDLFIGAFYKCTPLFGVASL